MPLVMTDNLTKIYGSGPAAITALDGVSLHIQPGEFVAVMGPSGCGKSTLLHLIGGLDAPTRGGVTLDNKELTSLSDDDLTLIRRRQIGFIFQFFNLIPVLSAEENAALPLMLDGVQPAIARERARTWLNRLGMGDRVHHRPNQLSGGEQQRVAIARALVIEPMLVLADEPTGNLDSRSGEEIVGLLRQAVDDWGKTVLMVTHDPRIASFADRIVFLKDGRIIDETRLSGIAGDEKLVRDRLADI